MIIFCYIPIDLILAHDRDLGSFRFAWFLSEYTCLWNLVISSDKVSYRNSLLKIRKTNFNLKKRKIILKLRRSKFIQSILCYFHQPILQHTIIVIIFYIFSHESHLAININMKCVCLFTTRYIIIRVVSHNVQMYNQIYNNMISIKLCGHELSLSHKVHLAVNTVYPVDWSLFVFCNFFVGFATALLKKYF